MDLRSEMDRAVEAALSAGKWLKSQRDFSVTDSSGRDIKMLADTGAEKRIFEILRASNFAILSEEAGADESSRNDACMWIVDPLDGTANYSREIPFCAVSIALCLGSKRLIGVVYDFLRDVLFTTQESQGAMRNKVRVSVSRITRPDQAILAWGVPIGFLGDSKKFGEYAQQMYQFKKLRMLGSAALSLASVACGQLDAYAEDGIAIWDVAAGLALVEAAGGVVRTELTADPWRLNVRATSTPELMRAFDVR